MARQTRLCLPNHLHMLLLRGHDGHTIARDDVDRHACLEALQAVAIEQGVSLHAYGLSPYRVALLATPVDSTALSRWVQSFGRRYVRGFNARHARRGTLWDGRFRAGLLQLERHGLDGMAFCDWLAVSDGAVESPHQWTWSSHGHYAGHTVQRGLVALSGYWGLGNTPFAREAAYSKLVLTWNLGPAMKRIESTVQAGLAICDADFVRQLELKTGRRLRPGQPGRPPNK